MSKLKWLLIIIVIILIAIPIASKLFPDTVDPFLQNSVIGPLYFAVEAISIGITTSGIWIEYGYWLAFFTGIVVFAFIAYLIWPRARPHLGTPTKKTQGYTPPKGPPSITSTSNPTAQVVEEPVKTPTVEAEVKPEG